jgi:hypothetical protein
VKDTKVAVRVNAGTEVYFNNANLKLYDTVKDGRIRIPLEAAESIEVFMAQKQKWGLSVGDTTNDFEMTFTRATWDQISGWKPMHGWAWMLIGMAICCGISLFCTTC